MSVKPGRSKSVVAAVLVVVFVAAMAAIASVYAPGLSEIMSNLERRLAWPP